MRLSIALEIAQASEHTYLMNGAGELDSERALNGAPGHGGRVGLSRWMESRTVPGYVGRFHATADRKERKGVGGGRRRCRMRRSPEAKAETRLRCRSTFDDGRSINQRTYLSHFTFPLHFPPLQ